MVEHGQKGSQRAPVGSVLAHWSKEHQVRQLLLREQLWRTQVPELAASGFASQFSVTYRSDPQLCEWVGRRTATSPACKVALRCVTIGLPS
jgi:hypothetical protein